ncbi:MAG TPA: hypothetical protein VN718_08875 [Rhizomicrobium sp.]|nr:hypothetical protein [Rhizomicrobium sp.]
MEHVIEKSPADTKAPATKEIVRRNADTYFVAWEKRTNLVKQQTQAESAAADAKTAKLRALRLAKEAADRDAEALIPRTAQKRRKVRAL